MSSKPRLILQEAIYQVRTEAARSEKIFTQEKFKLKFLKILENKLKKASFLCYGFSIEEDHYHLALKTSSVPISKFLQKINSTFARYYNKLMGTRGAVFSRPFTSLVVQEENGLKDLIRYIHLNPLRTNSCTVQELDSYKWCGHGALLNKCQNSFQNTVDVLSHFSEADKAAAYGDFVRCGFFDDDIIIRQIRDANSGKQKFSDPGHQVFGTDEFLKMAIKQDQCRRVKVPRHKLENITFEIIHENVEALLDLNNGELLRQGRVNVRSTARELFAYIARFRFDYSGVQIAQYFNCTDSAVSRMLSRFENIDKKEYLLDAVSELIFAKKCIAA